jgi:Tfp pilus assembly protein PilE
MMDDMIDHGWDEAQKIFHPQTLDANEKVFERQLRAGFDAILHHQVLARGLLPALTKASGRFSRAQATANQVAIACALERYHLKNRAYPESLAALVPNFIAEIPNEVVSTNAMRYLRSGSGYILYSAGWDQVDDGGALINTKNNQSQKGDWTWRVDR